MSIARRAGKRCRFVTRARRLSRPRRCSRRLFVKARVRYSRRAKTSVFRLRRRVRLPRGRYRVVPSARDLVGNVQRPGRGRRARVR